MIWSNPLLNATGPIGPISSPTGQLSGPTCQSGGPTGPFGAPTDPNGGQTSKHQIGYQIGYSLTQYMQVEQSKDVKGQNASQTVKTQVERSKYIKSQDYPRQLADFPDG